MRLCTDGLDTGGDIIGISNRARIFFTRSRSFRSCAPRSKARRMASSNSSLELCLVIKSSAPPRIACTVFGMSSCAEIKTTGKGFADLFRAACNSKPFNPGICRSDSTQPAISGASCWMNSSADSKDCTV